ncbi:MAG TPA: ArgE/DapE family deacylase [bacterium]|nr:ArgE/DapE family deacylase [bacterium]
MEIKNIVEKNLEKAIDFLVELIKFESVSGKGEEEIQYYIREKFTEFGEPKLEKIPESLKEDPEYTFADFELDYSKRKNLVLVLPSSGNGKSLILNTHSDVVPAEGWENAFSPEIKENFIIGRGSADAKGQIATIYLSLLSLKDLNIKPQGDLIVEIVIEEEIGGNGSLALIRQGYKADGVIVLEPTGLKITPANRGAIWFKIEIFGKQVHMGRIWEGVNAIEKMCFLIQRLKQYERKLIEESKNFPLFEKYYQPVQLNFGKVIGEGWPSMVCGKVILEGGLGFLPNKDIKRIKKEIEDVIENCGDEWIVKNYKLSFDRLHNDAYQIPSDHPLVKTVYQSALESGINPEITGFIASCDGRLFNKVGNMPTVVFGPGDLEQAHSKGERIKIDEIKIASEILIRTIIRWCGKE